MQIFGKITILGAGLLGASLAMAIKKHWLAPTVSVWSRREDTRRKCEMLPDVFDIVCRTPIEAVENSDLIVICTPTANIPETAEQIAPYLKDGAIVTDVGSVKEPICKKCAEIFVDSKSDFIGSHPMAGSEKIGIDFADETLFENRPCFIAPIESSNGNDVDKLELFWRSVGMKTYRTTPSKHDAIVANVSHLPHLLAGTLCINASKFDEDLKKYSGPGFRDTTRVASGSPEMWDSIVRDNKLEILSALNNYRNELSELIGAFESDDFKKIGERLRAAKKFRDDLQNTI